MHTGLLNPVTEARKWRREQLKALLKEKKNETGNRT
jgi:hypothetical protein